VKLNFSTRLRELKKGQGEGSTPVSKENMKEKIYTSNK
jgi:hypothetical protein